MKTIYRFTAAWCGPCKSLAKTLEGLDSDVEVIVIDIDSNRDMCEKYNIRSVPTLLNVDTGDTLVGARTLEEVKEWLNK